MTLFIFEMPSVAGWSQSFEIEIMFSSGFWEEDDFVQFGE
jgi:hypothetical protein